MRPIKIAIQVSRGRILVIRSQLISHPESESSRAVADGNSKRHKFSPDVENLDELAENSPPLHSTQPLAPVSQKGTKSKTRPARPNSNISIQESSDKPLPPTYLELNTDTEAQVRRPLQALRAKTTNLKLPSTKATLSMRPKLTTTPSQDSDFGAREALMPEQGTKRFGTLQPSSFDTENLSKKISGLMHAATSGDPRSNGKKGAHKFDDEPRSSPLKRGREVLSKATRSIASRFNGGKPNATPAEIHERIAQIYDERPITRDNTKDYRHPYMKVPSKPLPVYESMRSRRDSIEASSQPSENSLRENNHANRQSKETPAIVGLDLSFENPKAKNKKSEFSLREPLSFESKASSNTAFNIARHQRRRTFSNVISGLAQHPVADAFSSSPVDHSTPKIRLDSAPSPTKGDVKLVKDLQRSPSIIEFSFERSDTDRTSSHSSSPVAVTGTSEDELGPNSGLEKPNKRSVQSVKRKSSEVDLRSHLHPDNKRPRTLFAKDNFALVKHLGELVTKDDSAGVCGVLGERDPNVKMVRGPNTADPGHSTRKGLDIFQVPKGKAPERSGGRPTTNLFPPMTTAVSTSAHGPFLLEPVKRARGRPPGVRINGRLAGPDIGMSTRPTSILFSRESRESRGAVRARREWEKVREGNKDEEMEVDELAM